MSEQSKMAEHPTLPTTRPADGIEAAAFAVAILTTRGRHGQLCPVWVRRATIDACDCWILQRAHRDATTALATADLFNATQATTMDGGGHA